MNEQCGAWKLEREIGRGAYGVVYLAVGPGGERAAVKVCRRDAVGDERYARELRGAKLFMSIPPHEGLVLMCELVEEPWGFYTVLDLADDEFGDLPEAAENYRPMTLARVIESEKALPLKVCVTLAISLAKGLVALQRHHLLHRDIKPANVLFVNGRPVLSDPGLVVEEVEAASLVGTPGYVPPEKFTAAASDIYSLGLTLKAASFGRQVEDLDKGPSMEADMADAHFPAWWRILNKATDPTPSRRYQSAKALLRDLKAMRLKMAFSASPRSWVAKEAITIGVVLLIMFLAVKIYMWKLVRESVPSRKDRDLIVSRIKESLEDLNKKSSQEPLAWSSFSGSYFCHADDSHRQRLKRIEEKDPVRAAAMRDILANMQEIDKKGEENNRRIKALHDEAKAGKDASEKYNQAELLSMENEKLVKAWLSLLERFTEIEDAAKAKE